MKNSLNIIIYKWLSFLIFYKTPMDALKVVFKMNHLFYIFIY